MSAYVKGLDADPGESALLSCMTKQFIAGWLVGYTGRLVVTTKRMCWLPSRLDTLIGARKWELLIMDVVEIATDGSQICGPSRWPGSIVATRMHRPSARTKIAAADVTKIADAVSYAQG